MVQSHVLVLTVLDLSSKTNPDSENIGNRGSYLQSKIGNRQSTIVNRQSLRPIRGDRAHRRTECLAVF